MPGKSLFAAVATVVDTFRISGGTLSDSIRGTLTDESSNDRLTWWSHRIVAHAGMHVRTQGLQHRDPKRAYVVMSNHQSHFDIPVLFYAMGPTMRMIAKKELFRIPLFGPAMEKSGFISVDRHDRNRALKSLDGAGVALARGMSIWIAPEGTRSPTGALGPFKKGGFVLAMKSGAPILPVTIKGTHDALPVDAFRVVRGRDVDVIVHPAIEVDASDTSAAARDALTAKVRAAIESGL